MMDLQKQNELVRTLGDGLDEIHNTLEGIRDALEKHKIGLERAMEELDSKKQ